MSEYVIAFASPHGLPRYWSDVELKRVEGVGDASSFLSVSDAVSYIANIEHSGLRGGGRHLTIHRVVREPARVEEVPLKEALNEGLPLVAVFTDRGGRDYLSAPGAGPGSMSRDIARAVRFDRITDMLRNCRPFDIVGVREVPGSIHTEELA